MQPSPTRVVIGMSGGVDSSVAAYLLKEQGYDVVGLTMKVWLNECISQAEDACCGPSAVADARAVAHKIGIPHYVIDESLDFDQTVIGYFAAEYRAGRTPNPCVVCNEKVKFGALWTKAAALGASYLATGHYARVERLENGACTLRKGTDTRKDQSYFLFSLSQEQLGRTLFPLGNLSKPEIREIARRIGLKVADKADSQEICFVPGNDYKAFLCQRLGGSEFDKGGIYDKTGRFLGGHGGIELFTIGQRKGLPGGSPEPRYVIDIDPETRRVIVGTAADLLTETFSITQCRWHKNEPPKGPFEAVVKIRHGHPGAPATVTPLAGGRAEIRLHTPQRAVTPGQAAVCYEGDAVLGGGWIERRGA